MAILAVIADDTSAELAALIERLFPNEHFKVNDRTWLINAPVLARTLSEQLDVREGRFGRVLVLTASDQGAGWQAKSLWRWLTLKGASQ